MGAGRKLSSFLWWTYPRGSLEYDIMVGIILAFIFLTPRHFFRDQPRPQGAPFAPAFSSLPGLPAGPAALALLVAIPAPAPASSQASPTDLAGVIAALNAAAPQLHAVEADAEVTDYTALVQDSSVSSGKLYFERQGSGPAYALDLTTPPASAKKLVYRDRTAYLYTPASKQVEKIGLGDQQALVNQFLLLGMGSTGDALQAAYQVTYAGPATRNGTSTIHLTLVPKAPSAAAKFPRIEIWYDPATWIAVEQQLFQPGGDYHRILLSHIQRNPKIDGKVFSTSFPGATVVTPHS